jgi:hypothetical protein
VSRLRIAIGVSVVLLLAGCFAEPVTSVIPRNDAPGFWAGVFHGYTVLFSVVRSLVDPGVGVYAAPNSGGWYDFGFMFGALQYGLLAIRLTQLAVVSLLDPGKLDKAVKENTPLIVGGSVFFLISTFVGWGQWTAAAVSDGIGADPGFLAGAWNRLVLELAFIVSLFSDSVAPYQVGGGMGYRLGFTFISGLLTAFAIFGGAREAVARVRGRSRKREEIDRSHGAD